MVVALTVTGGCAATTSLAHSADGRLVPNQSSADPSGAGAALVGTLRGSAKQDCVWLVVRGSGRVPVVWGATIVAKADPVQVDDVSGRVLARAGDTIEGIASTIPAPAGDACTFGAAEVFKVHFITQVTHSRAAQRHAAGHSP